MSNKQIEAQIPHLRITDIKLRSLYYRIRGAETTSSDESSLALQGNIRYWFSAKKKNSFIMRSVQEIKLRDLLFRARHETRFNSDMPITKELYKDEAFQSTVVNMLLPFGSELFANLTGKSFIGPIIAPSEIPENEESDT